MAICPESRQQLSKEVIDIRALHQEFIASKQNSKQRPHDANRAYSRVSPIYSYPNNNILCSEQNLTIEGFYKLINERITGDLLAVPIREIDDDQPVLICGDGREILGSYSEDVLEGGTSNTPTSDKYVIRGNCGNDRLLGTNNNDTLYGDYDLEEELEPECNVPFTTNEGDIKEYTTDTDSLIGNSGNDTLVGGTGDNYYLPGKATAPSQIMEQILSRVVVILTLLSWMDPQKTTNWWMNAQSDHAI